MFSIWEFAVKEMEVNRETSNISFFKTIFLISGEVYKFKKNLWIYGIQIGPVGSNWQWNVKGCEITTSIGTKFRLHLSSL